MGKPEMKEVVNMCKPVDLLEIISVALKMESSSIYRVVSRDMNQENRFPKSHFNNTPKISSDSTNCIGWEMKTVSHEASTHVHRPLLTTSNRQQHKLTPAKLAEKRRLGLCYKCDDKWSKTHLYPKQSLHVLTVVDGFEMEVLDTMERIYKKKMLSMWEN